MIKRVEALKEMKKLVPSSRYKIWFMCVLAKLAVYSPAELVHAPAL
jgi:beta-lactamase regulating signal transducer with metallopeptidase domain